MALRMIVNVNKHISINFFIICACLLNVLMTCYIALISRRAECSGVELRKEKILKGKVIELSACFNKIELRDRY